MQRIYTKFQTLIFHKTFPVICLILFGAFIRLAPLAIEGINLPFRSGGLFVEFSWQIAANNYRLPDRIPFYSDGGIPFAYPPIPFYIEAFLISTFPRSEFVIANLLPPIIGIISLPFFYFLTREYGLNYQTQLAGLAAYATMPAAFQQQIESAGLAEAFGSLALILFAIFLVRAHKFNTLVSHILAGLFWAFCVGASPGSAYASVLMFFIFIVVQLVYMADHRTIFQESFFLLTMGIIAIILSSPYWLTVILNHGINVFLSGFAAQYGNLTTRFINIIRSFAEFNISGGTYHFIWDAMIFGGAIFGFAHRRWGLLAWFAALFCIPREGDWMVSIPASMLAGIGIAEVFGTIIMNAEKSRFYKPSQIAVIGVFSIYWFFNPIWEIRNISNLYNKEDWFEAINAMQWIREYVPAESKLIVISDNRIREWVPHVARRTVLNVSQGVEWEPNERENILSLNSLLNKCQDLNCIQANVFKMTGYQKVYLYIDKEKLSYLISSTYNTETSFNLLWENSKVSIGQFPGP